jgi:hypothetical protein
MVRARDARGRGPILLALMKIRTLLVPALLLFALVGVRTQSQAAPRLTELTGTALGFDQEQSLLSVNTRLGPKLFLVTPRTLFLLNNHEADVDDVLPGDEVTVRYQFDTSEARLVHLFREARQTARVTAATANSLSLRVRGATLTLQANAASQMQLANIAVGNPQVLVGQRVTAVFEPGSQLLLRLKGDVSAANGTVTAVNTTTNQVTLSGRRGGVFTLDPSATIILGEEQVTLPDVVVGSRARLAFVRSAGLRRGLALSVTPVATPPAATGSNSRGGAAS